MTFKRFGGQDLIYSTLVANPEFKFIIHSGSVYKNDDILADGDFSNKVNHIVDGQVSLHEINVNRPADALVYSFIEKDTTRYANRTISTSQFDDVTQFAHGAQITQSYPMEAGLSRILVPAGAEFSVSGDMRTSVGQLINIGDLMLSGIDIPPDQPPETWGATSEEIGGPILRCGENDLACYGWQEKGRKKKGKWVQLWSNRGSAGGAMMAV